MKTFEEAQKEFKGLNIKNKGYMFKDKTQLIFRSELEKKTKLAYFINQGIYLLPDPLKYKLQLVLNEEIESPAGIIYNKEAENFKVPLSYLQKISKDDPEVKEEINSEPINLGQNSYFNPINTEETVNYIQPVTNVTPQGVLTTSTQCYSVELLNKLATYLEKYKIVDSAPFILSTMTYTEDLINLIESEVRELDSELSEDKIIKIMSLLILLNIQREANQ